MNIPDPTATDRYLALRRRAGLTVTDVARRFGVGESSVKRWEKGSTPPPPAVIQVLEWVDQGDEPPGWNPELTGPAFRSALRALGLTLDQFGEIIDTPTETVELWASDDQGPPAFIWAIVGWFRIGYRPRSAAGHFGASTA